MSDSSCTVQLLQCLLPLALRWRESIVARELLCLQQCCTLLCCCKSLVNGHGQSRQIRVHGGLFFSSVPQIRFPRCYQKCDPSQCYRMQDQRYCLQAKLHTFAFCEKPWLLCKFRCGCFSLGWAYSWLPPCLWWKCIAQVLDCRLT